MNLIKYIPILSIG